MAVRPGGELASRPLHFIWLTDCSGSMNGAKISALNNAIREAIPHMRDVAEDNPNAEILVRALRFANGATWHLAKPTPVGDFNWVDLKAEGMTDLGHAFRLLADELDVSRLGERALPPVLVLISDGQPTDGWSEALKVLMNKPWAMKAVRLAIAIGEDADLDVLQAFIGTPEIKPLHAGNPEALLGYIKWVSTAVLKGVSAPSSQVAGASPNVLPVLPLVDPKDVW